MTLYNNNDIYSPLCCVPPEITTADDIVSAARALYPRPYISMETGTGDLARLETKGLVRLIKISEKQYAVFWCDWCRQKAVDADIRKLWGRTSIDKQYKRTLPLRTSEIDAVPDKKKKKIRLSGSARK
jgi:hypothetical protein